MVELAGKEDPFRAFQQTVETCALVICLWISKEQIWDTYTRKEKDLIAEFLYGYANGNTVPQNWRLFNMLDLAFLSMEGYPIDEDIMREHAQAIVNYYAGDGWYRDGQYMHLSGTNGMDMGRNHIWQQNLKNTPIR